MTNEEEIMLEFMKACGGVKFIQRIASGFDSHEDMHVVAAAKAAYCKWEQLQAKSKCAEE